MPKHLRFEPAIVVSIRVSKSPTTDHSTYWLIADISTSCRIKLTGMPVPHQIKIYGPILELSRSPRPQYWHDWRTSDIKYLCFPKRDYIFLIFPSYHKIFYILEGRCVRIQKWGTNDEGPIQIISYINGFFFFFAKWPEPMLPTYAHSQIPAACGLRGDVDSAANEHTTLNCCGSAIRKEAVI